MTARSLPFVSGIVTESGNDSILLQGLADLLAPLAPLSSARLLEANRRGFQVECREPQVRVRLHALSFWHSKPRWLGDPLFTDLRQVVHLIYLTTLGTDRQATAILPRCLAPRLSELERSPRSPLQIEVRPLHRV